MSGRLTGIVAVALLAVAPGCGGAGDQAATTTTLPPEEGCGLIIEEQLDPASGQHVFPGAPEPAYLSDPPTSGPHQVIGEDATIDEPLSGPIQVALLERGDVVIQVSDPTLVDPLVPLKGPDVVIAVNGGLPAPIVATAWLHKMLCEEPGLGALTDFVERFAGRTPEDHRDPS